jgi:ATP phosphoribosyltransferase-like protein
MLDITSTGADPGYANGLPIDGEDYSVAPRRLYAGRNAVQDPRKSKKIEDFCSVLRSVSEGRRRVMVEANVPPEKLPEVMQIFPAMKQPTVANLLGDQGYAIKSVVEKKQVQLTLIPALKAARLLTLSVANLAKLVL